LEQFHREGKSAMDNLASLLFLALVGAAVTAGIFAFFYLRVCKSRTNHSSGEEEMPGTPPMEYEEIRSYLEELENLPDHNQNKFLSVVKKYAGRDYMRALYLDNISRNLFLIIIMMGSSILSFVLLPGDSIGSIPICAIPFSLLVISSISYLIRSNAFFRSVREGEIRKARYRLRKRTNSPASTLFPSRVTFTKPVQVEPVSLPPVYQYPSTPAPSPASAKPRAGGFSFKHVLLILILFSAFLAFTDQFLVPGFIREFVNNFGVLGEVFDFKGEGISGCPKSFTDKYIVHPETCSSMSAGVTKPGYKWCDVTARQGGGSDWSLNGTNMRQGSLEQKWVPLICIK
jgi:hypothetical protein